MDNAPTPGLSELKQAILDQLAACLEALCSEAEAPWQRVHAARKHIKRMRALLALMGRSRFARYDSKLRLVGRSLGVVRDAVARCETWAHSSWHIEEPARAAIGALLEAERERLASPDRERRRLARAARVLGGMRESLTAELERAAPGEARLARGARESYQRARRALRRAGAAPSVASLHALRRAVKRHQYQLQFLEPLWKRPLAAQRKELEKLTELLGAHRDLSGIESTLESQPPSIVPGGTWRDDVGHWRRELLASALRIAHPALSERSAAFEHRLRGYVRAQATPTRT